MPQNRDTVLQIDLGALAHNYRFLRSKISASTRLMGVVKAYAYGNEAVAIARKLESLGADYLAVAFTDEGVRLREAGIGLPILVLHPQPGGMGDLIAHGLEPGLYSPRIFELFRGEAEKRKQERYPVHLKFNTGLNRLGFREKDLDWIASCLRETKALSVRSVFSHLAASDDPGEEDFTRRQIAWYGTLARSAGKKLGAIPLRHLLNTSGILNYPEAQWDMVRTGIGLYGYSNDPETDRELRPVALLRTRISQIHHIQPGEWVGYNHGYQADDFRLTATLPIGHADGIGRIYGKGKARFRVGDKEAPVIGNVCMDMTMIDVTGIDCREGDDVLIFGPGYSAEVQAARAGTISYELLAGISRRVEREIIDPDN